MSSMCPTTNNTLVFNPTLIQTQPFLPKEFIWSCGHLTGNTNNENLDDDDDELNEPLVDLDGFFRGDEDAIKHNAGLIKKACLNHGFFQVMNHGVDASLIQAAHDEMERIFELPWEKKLSVQRKAGSLSGYSGAHCDRFSKELPWKETFSFGYHYLDGSDSGTCKPLVVEYFNSVLGKEFEPTGWVYQRYCEAMKQLSYVIFEMLAISLGVERLYFKKFYEDGNSIMRCNSYPPCKEPGLTFGTGPHCDPTSLTILHQDAVGGLQVFADSKWQAVRPRPDAFVINIGDTFMALCNGRYKSCMHRVLVNKEKERRSLVYFVNPREDKVVRPPLELMLELDTAIKDQQEEDNNEQVMIMNGKNSKLLSRKYPDFKWHHLLEFTQNHHRADVSTLQRFFQWLPSSNLP